MSLVPTWVLADDGRWYEDPVLADESGYWYICFDDDEPIELVFILPGTVSKKDMLTYSKRLLSNLKINGEVTSTRVNFSGRCFPPDWEDVRQSGAVWINLKDPVPVAMIVEKDNVADVLPPGDKVFYNFNRVPPSENEK